MKCTKCKKDFCFWTELQTYTFRLLGFKNKVYEIVRKDICTDCANTYRKMEVN